MESAGKTANWPEEDFLEATADPHESVSMIPEVVPTLTVATIVAVTVVMLVAIIVVFLLGVLIDWRQQKLLDKQLREAKRMRNQRRVNTYPEDDSTSIANNMEESAISTPPAEALRNIP